MIETGKATREVKHGLKLGEQYVSHTQLNFIS